MIALGREQVVELARSLEPHAGVVVVPGLKSVVLQILKTEITDRDGKVVDIVD